MVDPWGGRGKRIAIAVNAADLTPPKTRPPKPRLPAVLSLLAAIVDSVPQLCQNAAAAQAPEEGGVGEKQLLTLPFHDSFAVLGGGAPVAVGRSMRVPTPSVRLRPFPDHAGRQGAGSRTAPAAPGSTGVPSTRAIAGGAPTG